MNLRRTTLTVAALLCAAGSAWAQNADLATVYKAGVGAEKCNLGLAAAKSSQLGDAVQRAEQRSGLAQADLDALWAKIQGEADADPAGFCASAADSIDKVISAGK